MNESEISSFLLQCAKKPIKSRIVKSHQRRFKAVGKKGGITGNGQSKTSLVYEKASYSPR